jgi:N-acetylglucosamine-6-phosphate deacetylase
MRASENHASANRRRFITNGTVVLPDRLLADGMVELNGSEIVAVHRRKRLPRSFELIDAAGGFIAPGFVDIHVHGGANSDFMDGTPDAVRSACAAHLRHGTTTIFPTTTTGSVDQILKMLNACATAKKESGRLRLPTIAGIHLYGPYFAEDKVGCHSKEGCRPPGPAEYKKYFQTKLIRVATCAAELPGASQFYNMAMKHKCLITCGHSNASWNEMQQAFENGMRHVDHFWCAMSSVPSMRQRFGVPMQGSMAEFVLMNPEMSTEVIADGCHLAPELLEFAYRMKGATRLCLVTDCNRALDMPAGRYVFGPLSDGTTFRSDGAVGWAENGSLASSVKGMDHMVRHMKQSTSATLPEVIRMASLTPAERTGISHQTGSLQPGKRADIVVLDHELAVQHVFVRGELTNGSIQN